jgi:hypothetical protein
MPKQLLYKGFTGWYVHDVNKGVYKGKVNGIPVTICFQGTTWEELEKSFRNSVDFYLLMLTGYEVQKPKPEINEENVEIIIDSTVSNIDSENKVNLNIQLPKEIFYLIQFFMGEKDKSIENFLIKVFLEEVENLKQKEKLIKDLADWEKLPRLIEAIPLEDFSIRVKFSDGVEGNYDLKPTIQEGGVFYPLMDIDFFKKVVIGGGGDYITWPYEIELGADTIYMALKRNIDAV